MADDPMGAGRWRWVMMAQGDGRQAMGDGEVAMTMIVRGGWRCDGSGDDDGGRAGGAGDEVR